MTKYLWSDDRMVNQHILADVLAKLLASRGVRHADTIPLAIATLLVFVLLPDGFAVMKKTEGDNKPAAATAPAKH